MSIHCNLDDIKATVTYKFANAATKSLIIKNVPIEVITTEKPISNFKYEIITQVQRTWIRSATPREVIDVISYQFRIFSNYVPTSIYFEPTGFRVVSDGFGYLGTENVFLINSNGTEKGGDLNFGRNVSPNVVPGSQIIHFQKVSSVGIRCESRTDSAFIVSVNPTNLDRCSINIKHNGFTIFTAKGDCPITYNVVCGEDCPIGTIKCFSSNYPGYCCLPCSEIKGEIKAITNQVKSLNKS